MDPSRGKTESAQPSIHQMAREQVFCEISCYLTRLEASCLSRPGRWFLVSKLFHTWASQVAKSPLSINVTPHQEKRDGWPTKKQIDCTQRQCCPPSEEENLDCKPCGKEREPHQGYLAVGGPNLWMPIPAERPAAGDGTCPCNQGTSNHHTDQTEC